MPLKYDIDVVQGIDKTMTLNMSFPLDNDEEIFAFIREYPSSDKLLGYFTEKSRDYTDDGCTLTLVLAGSQTSSINVPIRQSNKKLYYDVFTRKDGVNTKCLVYGNILLYATVSNRGSINDIQ